MGTGLEPRPPPIDVEAVKEIRASIPHSWLGFAEDGGQLVYLERSGTMDVDRLVRAVPQPATPGEPTKMLHYHVMQMEYQLKVLLPQESQRRGELVDKVIVINDLQGLGSQHVSAAVLVNH